MEYQLDGQFEDVASAKAQAGLYQHHFGDCFVDTEVEVRSVRETTAPLLVSGFAEDSLVSSTKELFTNTVKGTEKVSLTKAGLMRRAARSNNFPYLLCYGAFIVFAFSLNFSIEASVPVIGDWLQGWQFTPQGLARFLPYLLAVAVLYTLWRTVSQAMRFSLLNDCVLGLILEHGWRREDFDRLYREVLITNTNAWIPTLYKWVKPLDALNVSLVNPPTHSIDINRFTTEDFTNRVHSLYFLREERSYENFLIPFSPIGFLLRKDRLLLRSQVEERPMFLLPELIPRVRGPVVFGICIRFFLILAACAWSLWIAPPQSFFAWTGAIILTGVASGLPLLWNFQTIYRQRGFPRAWPLPNDWQQLERFILVM